jgi:hypothetical protein
MADCPTPHDDTPQRLGESSRSSGDSRRVVESREDNGSPQAIEPKYDAAAARRARAGPLTVKVELVVVKGPAADELIKRQAAAVRDALQWFAENPPGETRA